MTQIFFRNCLRVTGSCNLIASISGIFFRVPYAISAADNPYCQHNCGAYKGEGPEALLDLFHKYRRSFILGDGF